MEFPQYELYQRFLDFDECLILSGERSVNYPIQMFQFSEFVIDVLESKNLDEATEKYNDTAKRVGIKLIDLQIFQLPAGRAIELLDEIKSIYMVCELAILANDERADQQQAYIEEKNLMLKNAKIVYDHYLG